MKKLMCVALVLFATQSAIADYVLISGSRDDNSTKSIIRYRDTFDIIWERSEATGFADRSYNDIEVNPNDPNYGGGNLYTTQYEFDVGYLSARHFDAATGELLGQCVPSGYGEGQLDGTGTYNPTLVEGASLVLQDIVFGHDYNGDGVQDLWVCR